MSPVTPGQPIRELPYVVIEALGGLRGAYVAHRCIAEVESKQAGEASGVAVSDTQSVAELPHARGPAVAAIQRDMAPANASVVHQGVSNHAGPVANGVVNWRA